MPLAAWIWRGPCLLPAGPVTKKFMKEKGLQEALRFVLSLDRWGINLPSVSERLTKLLYDSAWNSLLSTPSLPDWQVFTRFPQRALIGCNTLCNPVAPQRQAVLSTPLCPPRIAGRRECQASVLFRAHSRFSSSAVALITWQRVVLLLMSGQSVPLLHFNSEPLQVLLPWIPPAENWCCSI